MGELARLEGVKGKGTANSCDAFFDGDFEGDLEGDLNGLGEGGVARIEAEEGDFGEEEASRRVRAEGFVGVGKGGSPASGMLGTGDALL